jgi:predicted ATP-grasp superfamily ATP-dependent carboligase
LFGPSAAHEPDQYLCFLSDLLRTCPHDVTIPLFDDSAAIVSRHKEELTRYTRIPIPCYDVFMHARDKRLTMQACERTGVPHPKTFDAELLSPEETARNIEFPCLVKPNCSYGALGIRTVRSISELHAAIVAVRRDFGPCCVQELIPQTGMQYKAQLFRGCEGRLHAAVVFSKIRYFPLTGGTSSLNRTEHRPDIVATCRKLLDAIGWTSHADVDLIEDPRDGQVKVMEINPRITGSIKIAFAAGVDFADLLVKHALGEPLPTYEAYRKGIYLRYMPLDILWFLHSPLRWRARPSWFRFFGNDLHYQEGGFDDPLSFAAGFLAGLPKYFDRSFRRAKMGGSS